MEKVKILRENISWIVKGRGPHKVHDPDEISLCILKECTETFDRPLKLFFEKSVDGVSFPEEWKIVNILLIFQKGDEEIALNCRPVPQTNTECQTLKIIIKQMD